MKKTVISLLAMLVSVVAFGEKKDSVDCSSHTVIYEYKINTLDKDDKPVTDVCELVVQVGRKVTKCAPMIAYNTQTGVEQVRFDSHDKEQRLQSLREYGAITMMHLPIVFTGYPKGKVTTQEMILPNLYVATDKYRKPRWQVSGETKTLNGHLCHAATAQLAGKTWHVWFTKDAGISAGPWKLQGLKGLIVSATDEEGIHSFQMKEIKEEKMPIYYYHDKWEAHLSHKTMKIMKTTSQEMISLRSSLFDNPEYLDNPLYYDDTAKYGTAAWMQFDSVGLAFSYKGCNYFTCAKVKAEDGHEYWPYCVHKFQPLEE